MSNYAISLKRTTLLLAALAFTAALLVANLSIFSNNLIGAEQVTSRSMNMTSSLSGSNSNGAADSETNGADATHTFTFDPATSGTIRGIRFLYCTTAINTCTPPTGLDVNTTPAVTVQQNEGVTFTNAYTLLAGSTDNNVAFVNATGNTFTAGTGGTITFAFDDITNPTVVGTFFVRITTYSDAGATTPVDTGTVASAITTGIAITTKVVETLGFSTTALINTTGIPPETSACVPLTGTGAIALGDSDNTLSISTAYDAYSAFRIYTNAANGATVQYEGASLTKGTDVIDAVGASATASAIGTEQFGLAVDLTRDSANANLANADSAEGGAGQIDIPAAYNQGNGTIASAFFAFVADTKTSLGSSTSYVTCDTYAVQYLGNISPLTPAGTYTTTIVYFAVPVY